MTSFLDMRFPTDISYGSRGGPQYKTSVIVMESGTEKRNIDWTYPLATYDVMYGIKHQDDLQELINFFHVAMGKAYTFRYRDPMDWKSCLIDQTPAFDDQTIGTGDGSETEFQIIKTYDYTGINGSTLYTKTRQIIKPVPSTLLVGVNGVATTSYSVDTDTGIITFNSAPGDGLTVTAGYQFDVHARFDTDSLSTDFADYESGSQNVPIVEIKSG